MTAAKEYDDPKPCPICGTSVEPKAGAGTYSIRCYWCGLSMSRDSLHRLLQAWNTRAEDRPDMARILHDIKESEQIDEVELSLQNVRTYLNDAKVCRRIDEQDSKTLRELVRAIGAFAGKAHEA